MSGIPRSTPLANLDQVIRLREGLFLPTLKELAQPGADSHRLRWPRTQGGQKTKTTFVETRDQLYYLSMRKEINDATTAYLEDGHSFDGKTSWKWRKVVLEDGTDVNDAEKGTDQARRRRTEMLLQTGIITRKFLGASLLKGGSSVIQQVLENSATKVLPDQVVDGVPCSVMQVVETMGTSNRRVTLRLDRNKQSY